MKIQEIKPAISAFEILKSLKCAIDAKDDIDFEEFYSNAKKDFVLNLSWTDQHTEENFEISCTMAYTSDINYENCCKDVDIDSLNVYKITYGFENVDLEIPSGINEHTLAPLLTEIFDEYNKGVKFEEPAYSINLLSEISRKRGENWILINQAEEA